MAQLSSNAILAMGAWLKNAACLWQPAAPGKATHWSANHGDLSDPAACAALRESAHDLLAQARSEGLRIRVVAHDLHPDFFSSQLGIELADALGVEAIGVQHHLAHVGAVMAAHQLNEPVIGLALDGVGLGADGKAWGGELMWVNGAQWKRLGHLSDLALPGGDRAAREPWRMQAAVLHSLGRSGEIIPRLTPVAGQAAASTVAQMLDKQLNCPRTSSTGRWFDAAASALDICQRQQDEAEAAIALEAAARRALDAEPLLNALPGARVLPDGRLDLGEVWAQLLDADTSEVDRLAAGFHLALANALATWASEAASAAKVRTVALSGGCFFNRILRERVTQQLEQAGLRVCLQTENGCGDAGLALGQAWVAAQHLAAQAFDDETTKELPTCA